MRQSTVPADLVRFTPGQLGKSKQRSQVGYTNRRSHFATDVVPALHHMADTLTLASALRDTVERSRSAMDASRSGTSMSNSNTVTTTLAATKATSSPNSKPCDELLDALHFQGHRSYTPESFFFHSSAVGSGGQLQEDRASVLRRATGAVAASSQAALTSRAVSRNAGVTPAPLPNHAALLSNLLDRSSSGNSAGLAGLLSPPCMDDTSSKSLAHTVIPEPSCNRHLASTPTMNARFEATGGRAHSVPPQQLSADRRREHQQHFFVSIPGRDDPTRPSAMLPSSALNLAKPKFRLELTDYHNTHCVVQPPSNAGLYASEEERFTTHDRGLRSSLLAQRSVVESALLHDIKAERKRAAQQRVVAECINRDSVLPNRLERRIAAQREVALATWRDERARVEAVMRRQAEMDERSEAALKLHKQRQEALHAH